MEKLSIRTLSFNKIINFFLFLYILSLYLFTFRTELTFVSNGLALMLISLIGVNNLALKKKLVYNKLLFWHLAFIIITAFSILYSLNQETASTKVRTLILIFIVMLFLTNYIDTERKINKVIGYFIISGFIASIYILLTSDLSQSNRIGYVLGNVNEIGMIIGISATFCFYRMITEKKIRYSIVLFIMIVVILLTGSRKSLLFIISNIIIIYSLNNKDSLSQNIKTVVNLLLAGLVLYFLVFNVPLFYQIIGTRLENTFDFLLGSGTTEKSMNIRANMISFGMDMFKNRPLLGHGIDNYRRLMERLVSGIGTYAHNNYIELLVDVGIVGTVIYYLTHLITLKNLIKRNNNLANPFIAIILSYLVIGITLVYYDNKHFSFLLAIGATIPELEPDKCSDKNNN